MNSYEQKREARISRMRASAERKAAEGAAKVAGIQPLLECMNGTPLLIGHHSQARHERDRKRVNNALHAGVDLAKEAESLAHRADAAETSTAVSSDDPEAIEKLRAQLAEAKRRHDYLLMANGCLRKGEAPHALEFLASAWGRGNDAAARTLATWQSMGHKTIPTANSSADIRRLEKRIAEIETKASAPAKAPERIGDIEIVEAENRVRITFAGKPDEKTIAALKASGFRWTPSEGVWQRHASNQAWFWARKIAEGTPQ